MACSLFETETWCQDKSASIKRLQSSKGRRNSSREAAKRRSKKTKAGVTTQF